MIEFGLTTIFSSLTSAICEPLHGGNSENQEHTDPNVYDTGLDASLYGRTRYRKQERANGPTKQRSGYSVRRTDSSLEKNTADSKTHKQTQDHQCQQSPRVTRHLG